MSIQKKDVPIFILCGGLGKENEEDKNLNLNL